jgi:hypothetical protein
MDVKKLMVVALASWINQGAAWFPQSAIPVRE